jgi:Cu2+-exporting ATPase
VHLLALAAFALWWGLWGAAWQDALLISVTVLIITCPCALGLAVPVVQVLATGQLMKRGILVKSGDALERLAAIDSVFFDKTGTLTLGQPQLKGDYVFEELQLAASLAANSAHPLAKALHKAFDGELLPLTDIKEHAGQGLSGLYCEQEIKIGRRSFAAPESTASESQANSEICLSIDGVLKCCFTFEDALKSDAKDTIHKLQNKSLNIHLISGDLKPIVSSIARQLDIKNPHGEVTPVEKSELLESEKSKGHKVLMVGDGLNDAPVLAGAHVSMAPGSAVDMAQNVTDIVFMGDKLAPVTAAHDTAVLSQKLVKENFALAIAYNCIAVPLAFAGMVTPMVAAIAMSGSSLLVIANSYRLKLQKD